MLSQGLIELIYVVPSIGQFEFIQFSGQSVGRNAFFYFLIVVVDLTYVGVLFNGFLLKAFLFEEDGGRFGKICQVGLVIIFNGFGAGVQSVLQALLTHYVDDN